MITPRQTRLLRARSLRSFQHAIADVTRTTDPFVARRTTVLVPTRAAAGRLRKTLEELLVERSPAAGVLALPVLQTRDDWYRRLHDGLADAPPLVTPLERRVVAMAAARDAAADAPPPFKLRPGLIPAIIAFHDELLRFRTSVDAFERLTLEELEPSADLDRGARRLIRQTHFLAAAFRRYATRLEMAGRIDEHGLRRLLTAPAAAVPAVETHVVVTVGDRTSDETGLWPADFDLLTRLPALTRVDVVATETRLAAGLGERLSELLPGMTEEVIDEPETPGPVVVAPASSPERPYFLWRDREEELAGVVRTLKSRQPPPDGAVDDGIGVVFQHPLPYLYLARQLFETSGVPYETRDALPLAAEPYAAAVDLVCRYVASGYDDASRDALLGSPHFSFTRDDEPPPAVATRLESELAPLRTPGSASVLLDVFVSFLRRHAAPAGLASPGDQRSSRARAGIWAALDELGRAHRRFDDSETTSDELMATVRRWIESQTFAPRAGAGGVQLVETQSAVYGRFHELFLVGLTEGEWPERPGRNIFYPSSHLIALGWPRERERLRAARARFVDLVRLSSDRVALSTFMLEDDAVVTPSSLLEDVEDGAGVAGGLTVRRVPPVGETRVSLDDALSRDPVCVDPLPPGARDWLTVRRDRRAGDAGRFRGEVGPQAPRAYAVRALEQYLDCPFKYFAAARLGLGEDPAGEQTWTPQQRGLFLHRVMQDFFEQWQSDGGGSITLVTLEPALETFRRVCETALTGLPAPERAVTGVWLLGSAAAPGLAERLFLLEVERPGEVVERLMEFRVAGDLEVGDERRPVTIKGAADRIDLMDDGTFHVFDYKSSRAPNREQALQLPLYTRAAERLLDGRHDRRWRAGDAAYLAFGDPRLRVPLTRGDLGAALDDGDRRLLHVLEGLEAGHYPPTPAEIFRCTFCPYPTVCRKDYVGDD